MTSNVSTELIRQRKALDQLPPDYMFPLFNAKHALESQRRSGYRSTAAAAREIVDNAIEAGARRVDVIIEPSPPARGPKTVSSIAFIDNGPGMLPDMARYALSWGGGTHFEEHDFIGRFGFGLPNASINQTRRVEVYTRTVEDEAWIRTTLDINNVTAYGLQQVEPAERAPLPAFVTKYLKTQDITLTTGTVVVWVRPDRLTYKAIAPLKEHLIEDFGMTYRYLLKPPGTPEPGVEIRVENVLVGPVDPLFLLPTARLYLSPDHGGAVPIIDDTIIVRYVPDPEHGDGHLTALATPDDLDDQKSPESKIGAIRVRVVRFPVGFAVDRGRSKSEVTDANRRHDIRKRSNGMSFVRAKREVTTLTSYPRSPQDVANGLGKWPDLQAYTYHVGVEVQFDPELDDVFGITNDKQGVRPIEDFWRLLASRSIDSAVAQERQWQVEARKAERQKAAEPKDDERPTPAEVAARAADMAGTAIRVPEHHAAKAEEAIEAAARSMIGAGAMNMEEARRILREQQRRRPYRIRYVENPHAPFYEPHFEQRQVVVDINKSHPFYDVLYTKVLSGENPALVKSGLDLLLITLARAEIGADHEEMELWYRTQREQVWTTWLATSLRTLGQSFPDDLEIEDEGAETSSGDAEVSRNKG